MLPDVGLSIAADSSTGLNDEKRFVPLVEAAVGCFIPDDGFGVGSAPDDCDAAGSACVPCRRISVIAVHV